MPHSTEKPLTNGSQQLFPNSSFVDHLLALPVISEALSTLQQNAYTGPAIHWASETFTRVAQPIEPYLAKPYSYAAPYVAKADELADHGLGRVETTFPLVREPPAVIVEEGKKVLGTPYRVAREGGEYVWGTWNDEYRKTLSHPSRSPGLSTSILALISTELKLASDMLQRVADFVGPRYESTKDKLAQQGQEAKGAAEKTRDAAAEKVDGA